MTSALPHSELAQPGPPQPFYLPGSAGPLFCLLQAPAAGVAPRCSLLYLPPFAEEANRSRRMAVLQARRLAALGIDVLLLDPFGTGDSAGEFGEARWETWVSDAEAALQWLRARCGGKVGLWGLRLGALLAAEVAAQAPDRVARLLLWQPVLSGDRYLTQFLRLRVAGGMAGQADKESTKDLRARLAQGKPLEVGGYELAPALAKVIDDMKLADLLAPLGGLAIDWLEVSSGEAPELLPASRQLLDALEGRGASLNTRIVTGEPFWAIQEFTLAPALLEATDGLFRP